MILGIDPGNTQSGFVVLHGDCLEVSDCGVLPNDEMQLRIDDYFQAALGDARVAIEHVQNMGMIVGREVFETIHWAGRFYEQCYGKWSTESQLVYRSAVKLHLCGSARAKDPNVRQALLNRFGAENAIGRKANPGPLYSVKSHAWSALAVAVFALDNPEGVTVAEAA